MIEKPINNNSVDFEMFESLFNQYYDEVMNFVYYKCGETALAEDITQETFVKLWQNISRVEVKTIKAYLFTISSNLFKNHYKRKKLDPQFAFNYVHPKSESPEYLLEVKEFDEILQNALSSLPEKCRIVFLMNRIDKLTYNEIADRLDLSVKAIEKRMSKAINMLEKKVKHRL